LNPHDKTGRVAGASSKANRFDLVVLLELELVNNPPRDDRHIGGRIDLRWNFRHRGFLGRTANGDKNERGGRSNLLIIPVTNHRQLPLAVFEV
jgi:hypothetical protein